MKLGRRPLTADCEFEPLGGVWPRRLCVTACLLFSAFFFAKSVPGSPLHSQPTKSQLDQAANPLAGVFSSASTPLPAVARDPEVRQVGRFLVRPKKIEDVQSGDKVLAQDPATGELAAKEVAQTFQRVTDHLRILEIRNSDGTTQTIETTDEHPFMVPGRGMVNAGDLAPGDRLTQSDGQLATVVSTRRDNHPEGIPVYNFEVADLHTYFVSQSPGAPPVLVHNNCLPPVVIGEGMERVGEFAAKVGGKVFVPKGAEGLTGAAYRAVVIPQNRMWIRRMMSEGRTILDMGILEGRVGGQSPFYAAELEEILTRNYSWRIPLF